MSRNFGAGSRDMADAARIFLGRQRDVGGLSFESVAANSDRFNLFAVFAKAKGVGRMDRIDDTLVIEYGLQLAARVKAGTMKAAYAQNLVSAINTVLATATGGRWRSVSPTKDCCIQKRSNVRTRVPGGFDLGRFDTAIELLDQHGQAFTKMLRDFGLRSKEGALLDCNRALREAMTKQQITVVLGTKGGKARTINITSQRQLKTLQAAAEAQGKARNLIPADESWAKFQAGCMRDIRETLQAQGIEKLHDLRASFACARYEQITGFLAPVFTGVIQDRARDLEARSQISIEIGHERIEVNGYVGGRK